jgi:hypothetical protein
MTDDTIDDIANRAAEGINSLVRDSDKHAAILRTVLNLIPTLLISRVLAPRALVRLTQELSDAGLNVPVLDRAQAKRIWRPIMLLVGFIAYRAQGTPERSSLEDARKILGMPSQLRRVK